MAGYNVYRCEDGSDEVFLGFARNKTAAKKMKNRVGIQACMYDTLRAAGDDRAPNKAHESGDFEWISASVCICEVLTH